MAEAQEMSTCEVERTGVRAVCQDRAPILNEQITSGRGAANGASGASNPRSQKLGDWTGHLIFRARVCVRASKTELRAVT